MNPLFLVHLFALLAGMPASAAIVQFEQCAVDDATGSNIAAVASNQWLETGVEYCTVAAPDPYSSYRFTYWSNDSYPAAPYRDAWGRSRNPISFILLEDTIATAHYLPATRDTDADGVPDWFEIEYYGVLTNGAAYNNDGDAFTLAQEYSGGTHPMYGNTNLPGGVFYADSGLVTCNLAGYPTYVLRSVPPGTVAESNTVPPGTMVTSANLSANAAFGYWTLDGVRRQDSWGVAYPQITFTVQATNREGVAYLFPGDGDGDGVPDAFEQYYLGTLTNGASSDADGDGWTLAQEYSGSTHPLYANTNQPGGVFWTDSGSVTVNMAGFSRYTLRSEPAGTLYQSAIVATGTVITTPSMGQSTFGYWNLDGVRQEDAWGVALRQFSFTVGTSDREAVAWFFAADSDGDGVNDGFEYYYYNTLTNGAASDTDGDGVSLLAEYAAGTDPRYGNINQPGGVFWRDSALVVVNLQPFERLEYALCEGVLTRFFTLWPTNVTGISFGSHSYPALGDWDGDGDLDLWAGSASGRMTVYENRGSRTSPNLFDVGANFSALSGAWIELGRVRPFLGDWNRDGLADLALGGDTSVVRIVSSTAHFNSPQTPAVNYALDVGVTSCLPAILDVTGDGWGDLLVLKPDGLVSVYTNTRDASLPFAPPAWTNDLLHEPAIGASGLSVGDVNADAAPDVLLSDRDGRIWEFWFNSGNFVLHSKVFGGAARGFSDTLAATAGDLDGDGDTDLVCGFAQGGLLYLRDPKLGMPADLHAFNGAASIKLTWEPNRSCRLLGYYAYRAPNVAGPFARLPGDPLVLPEYTDTNVSFAVPYYYTVTALSAAYYPGNSMATLVESRPSSMVTGVMGAVALWMPDYSAITGTVAVLQVNVKYGSGISATGMDIRVTYDPILLTPLSQIGTNPTVEKTALTETLDMTNNADVAGGELRIIGSHGVVIGEGHLFDIKFMAWSNATIGTAVTSAFSFVALNSEAGDSLAVDHADTAVFTVAGITNCYFLGDIDGDCLLNMDDHAHMMWLLQEDTRDPTPQELAAGDLNGNGEIDHKDIPLLLRLIHGKD